MLDDIWWNSVALGENKQEDVVLLDFVYFVLYSMFLKPILVNM